jgi:ribosomal-protein-alanine N-acetyltransferase
MITLQSGYTTEDIDRMHELEKICFSKAFCWSRKDFVEALKTCDTIKGIYDNQIAGYVLSEIRGDTGHVISLTVDPEYRRKGFGANLLNALELAYLKKGVSKIKLEVHTDNPAQILYFKAGYRITGFRHHYYSNGSSAIVMVKSLKK